MHLGKRFCHCIFFTDLYFSWWPAGGRLLLFLSPFLMYIFFFCIHWLNFLSCRNYSTTTVMHKSQDFSETLTINQTSKDPPTLSVAFLFYLSQHFPLIVMKYFSNFISDLVSKPQLHTNSWLFSKCSSQPRKALCNDSKRLQSHQNAVDYCWMSYTLERSRIIKLTSNELAHCNGWIWLIMLHVWVRQEMPQSNFKLII